MAATTSLPPRCPGHPALVHEQHPDLGDYVYSPSVKLWTNWRITTDGHEFRLSGHGRRPAEDQVQLWASIEGRLEELAAKGVAAIGAPPGKRLAGRIRRAELSLREVRMEPGEVVEFFFGTPLCDEINIWAMATFQGFVLRGWRWLI